MSVAQIRNFRFYIQTLRSLKRFGLNPCDWKLDRATAAETGRISIYHRHDHQFTLIGEVAVQNGTAKLQDLSLASI
jgi:hypothetical protein